MLAIMMLAAGLLAAPQPQAEPQKGWVVELHGYTYHSQGKPKEWIVEVQVLTYHKQAKPNRRVVEVQIEAVEAVYIDDLPSFYKQLKKR